MSDSNIGVILAGAIGSTGGVRRSNRSIGPIIANVTVDERHVDELVITEHPVEQGASIADHVFKRPAELTLRVGWSNSGSGPQSILDASASALVNKLSGSVQNELTGVLANSIGGSALGNLAVANLGSMIGQAGVNGFGVSINNGTGKGTSAIVDVYQQLLDLQVSAVPFDVYTGKRKYSNMMIASMTVETDVRTENALIALLVCKEVIIVSTSVQSVAISADNQASPEKTNPPVDAGTKHAVVVQPDANLPLAKQLTAIFGG